MTAKADSRSHAARKRRKGGGGNGIFFTVLLLMVPLALLVAPAALLVLIGLIPTMVAAIVDRDPDKSAPIAVGSINICGILPFVIEAWKHQYTVPETLRLVADPVTLLVMFGAAAVGWAFYYAIPPMVMSFEVMRAEARIESLQGTKRDLIEEWGPDVALDDEALERKLKAEPPGPTSS